MASSVGGWGGCLGLVGKAIRILLAVNFSYPPRTTFPVIPLYVLVWGTLSRTERVVVNDE